jgi:hypothetical protein
MRRCLLPTEIARWWWLSTLTALILLGSVSGFALAQETSMGTMQVVVLPQGDDLQSPTPETAVSGPSQPAGRALGIVTASLRPGAPAPQPDGSMAVAPFMMTVADERGTAYGWQVTLHTHAPAGGVQPPSLIANRSDTITMLLPVATSQVDVAGARVLGPLDAPLPLLSAPHGTGAGVYTQRLLVAYDGESAPERAATPFLIGLPSAP